VNALSVVQVLPSLVAAALGCRLRTRSRRLRKYAVNRALTSHGAAVIIEHITAVGTCVYAVVAQAGVRVHLAPFTLQKASSNAWQGMYDGVAKPCCCRGNCCGCSFCSQASWKLLASYTNQGNVAAAIITNARVATAKPAFQATHTLQYCVLPWGRYLGLRILASQCLLHHTTLAGTRSLPATPSGLLLLLLLWVLALVSPD
jgi:hypothetical protein